MNLCVKRLSEFATIPSRKSSLAAGYDLSSARDLIVPALGKVIVPTDLCVVIPPQCYGRIAARSSLAANNHIAVGGGVIDADYRGPVGIILFNHGDKDFLIHRGDRVAQLILEVIATPNVEEIFDELPSTSRGSGGFGSTGAQ